MTIVNNRSSGSAFDIVHGRYQASPVMTVGNRGIRVGGSAVPFNQYFDNASDGLFPQPIVLRDPDPAAHSREIFKVPADMFGLHAAADPKTPSAYAGRSMWPQTQERVIRFGTHTNIFAERR